MITQENVPTNLTEGILKFLAPSDTNWQELKPLAPDTATDEEKKRIETEGKEARNSLNETLLVSLQMQNLMVVAGCGTSLSPVVKGPSMSNLWDAVEKLVDPNKTEVTRENISNKIKYIADKVKPNIEDFLSHCDAYLQVNKDKEVFTFVSLCKSKILDECSFCMADERLIGHTTFLHRLSRRRVRDSRLKLFTTNYDLCFETAAGKQGIIVLDGFSFTQPRFYDPRFFGYDIVRRPRTGEDLGNYLEGVIQLYKLHGSVNWARSSDGKSITTKEKTTPDEACLIYPGKGKYQQSYIQPHLELIAQYLSSLREPNTCLIVTGFGFNDGHLSEPILSAVKTNPHLRLIVTDCYAEDWINGKAEASPHWKELFDLAQKGEDIWFINASFQDFAELIPDLKSLTPPEKLTKNIRSIAGGH
ncbi:MAG: SIR2 family protein [Bacteroidetes bacterium]|nr:SIR2 family protein [Bacteroidota bacterium]